MPGCISADFYDEGLISSVKTDGKIMIFQSDLRNLRSLRRMAAASSFSRAHAPSKDIQKNGKKSANTLKISQRPQLTACKSLKKSVRTNVCFSSARWCLKAGSRGS